MSTDVLGINSGIPMLPQGQDYYNMMAEIDPYFNVFGADFTMRNWDGMISSAQAGFNRAEVASISTTDMEQMKPLIDNLGKWRIFGNRVAENNAVIKMLDYSDVISGKNKAVALFLGYTAEKGGLKDPNGSLTYENLKDPDLFVKESRSPLSFMGIGNTNKVIEQLQQTAVKARDPYLAAIMLNQAGYGIATDEKGVEKILVDSKNEMSDGEHAVFVADTANAYQKLYGESLDDFLRVNYSPIGNGEATTAGAATGAAIGFFTLGVPGALVGAAIGAVAGTIMGETSPLPAKGEGQKLINTVTEALQRANKPNYDTFNMMYG